MQETKDLFKALVADDYSGAKQHLHGAINKIINNKIEARKEEIRKELSVEDS